MFVIDTLRLENYYKLSLPALLQSQVDLTAFEKSGLWFSQECQPLLAQVHV